MVTWDLACADATHDWTKKAWEGPLEWLVDGELSRHKFSCQKLLASCWVLNNQAELLFIYDSISIIVYAKKLKYLVQ